MQIQMLQINIPSDLVDELIAAVNAAAMTMLGHADHFSTLKNLELALRILQAQQLRGAAEKQRKGRANDQRTSRADADNRRIGHHFED